MNKCSIHADDFPGARGVCEHARRNEEYCPGCPDDPNSDQNRIATLEADLAAARAKAKAFQESSEKLNGLLLKAEAERDAAQADAERLEWMLNEPEGARHLLSLLQAKRGDKDAFKTMVDRIRNAARGAA